MTEDNNKPTPSPESGTTPTRDCDCDGHANGFCIEYDAPPKRDDPTCECGWQREDHAGGSRAPRHGPCKNFTPAASPPVEPGEPDERIAEIRAREQDFYRSKIDSGFSTMLADIRWLLDRDATLTASLSTVRRERDEARVNAQGMTSSLNGARELAGWWKAQYAEARGDHAAAESRALAAEQRIEAIRGVLEQCRPAVEQHSAALTGLIDAALATLSPEGPDYAE